MIGDLCRMLKVTPKESLEILKRTPRELKNWKGLLALAAVLYMFLYPSVVGLGLFLVDVSGGPSHGEVAALGKDTIFYNGQTIEYHGHVTTIVEYRLPSGEKDESIWGLFYELTPCVAIILIVVAYFKSLWKVKNKDCSEKRVGQLGLFDGT
jgi:hypothetical protein